MNHFVLDKETEKFLGPNQLAERERKLSAKKESLDHEERSRFMKAMAQQKLKVQSLLHIDMVQSLLHIDIFIKGFSLDLDPTLCLTSFQLEAIVKITIEILKSL